MKVGKCKLLKHCEIGIGKSVSAASKVLAKNQCRNVYVVKKKVPMGVVSVVDIVNDVVAKGKSAGKTKVESIMRSPLHVVSSDDSIVDAYLKIAQFNLVALPVLKNKKIVGILSAQEIMKHFVKKGAKK